MTQIKEFTKNQSPEHIQINMPESGLDFVRAKQAAKDKALEKCDHPMILSWKNAKTGQSYPDYECGINKKPFWIRYAEGRGANLTIDINQGDYVFMILKI